VPFIGELPSIRNCYAAVGHFRSGIQLSLGTARILVDGVANVEVAIGSCLAFTLPAN